MTMPIGFPEQPLVHALGWTLLHFCWQGALVAVLLGCVLALLDGRSPRARYAAALCAMGLMVALPMATFGHIAAAEYRMHSAMAGPAIDIDPGIVLQIGAAGVAASWPVRVTVALDHAMPWILLAWLTGVVAFAARLNLGFVVARRLRTAGTELTPSELIDAFEGLRRRLGVRRAVRLMNSALVQVPTVIGWLRPVVLVPVSCLTGLSAAQIEAILAHELAHVRRHDYLVSVAQSVVETLLFYHPAVWWVSRQVRRERECCCDDLAVAVGGDRLAYARALSSLEQYRAGLPAMVLGANGGVLTMRIKRLLGLKESSVVSQVGAAAVLAVLVAVAGVAVGTIARADARTAVRVAREKSPVELVPPAALNARIAPQAVPQVRLAAVPVLVAAQEATAPPEVPPAGPVRVSAGTMAGSLLSRPNPVYPLDAKAARVQGAVVLHALISKTGTIENLQVISGPEMLRESAIDAVQRWTYKPYLLNGEPVRVDTTITVNYMFGDGGAPPEQSSGPVSGPIRVSAGTMAGSLISRPDPIYPPEAKEARIQGAVVLRASISAEGKVKDLRVVSGPTELVNSAIDAVKQSVYQPYLLNGEPTEVVTTITVNYMIGGSAAMPDEGGVVPKHIGDGISAPKLVSSVPPEYTEAARAAKVNGYVLVSLWVDEQGNPTHVRVAHGIDRTKLVVDDQHPQVAQAVLDGLNEKAVEAIKRYKFKPAMENGKPVVVELNVETNFQIF